MSACAAGSSGTADHGPSVVTRATVEGASSATSVPDPDAPRLVVDDVRRDLRPWRLTAVRPTMTMKVEAEECEPCERRSAIES